MPDGFLDAPTSVAAAAVAVGGVGVALRRTRDELAERGPALAGLTAAFVFAAQLLNVPVAAGTSGHLLGGALAAVLVGPWLAVLCLTVVVVLQCLLFADGGLSALGINVVNMGLVTCLGGWLAFRALRASVLRSDRSLPLAAGLGAGCSVVLSSLAFTAEFALGGTAPVSVRAVLAAMVSVHALIGVGEGVLTALVVAAVLAHRPDLVAGAHAHPRAQRGAWLVPVGLGLATAVAVGLSPWASTAPDGLERVAGDLGIAAAPAVIGSAVLGSDLAGRLAGVALVSGVVALVAGALTAARRGPDPAPLRALPAPVKVVAALAFVLGVVLTPRTAVAVFVLDAAAVGVVAHLAGLRPLVLARRLAVELPFLAFAAALPFVATGPQVALGPLSLSAPGLWAAWGIVAKGTLGVAVAVVLVEVTPVPDLLDGLRRLRVPAALCAIAGFMARYGVLLRDDLRRLQVARVARGDDPRWLWQARSVARTAGATFVRSFERGERVQVAMAARGYDGRWPATAAEGTGALGGPARWLPAAAFATVAVAGAAFALTGAAGGV